jgi:hypothetical protein
VNQKKDVQGSKVALPFGELGFMRSFNVHNDI